MLSRYITVDSILEIQSAFQKYVRSTSVNLHDSPVSDIRRSMFEFFEQQNFLENYMQLAKASADLVGLQHDNLVLQSTPTPRVFRPGTHGTSFHCDYWYGHGLQFYTIWLPLTPVEPGNSFFVCAEEYQKSLYEKLENTLKFIELEEEILTFSSPVLPKSGSAFIFNSKVLHGSPTNISSKTRVSFDFRIGHKSDVTSTKDLANYYHFKDGLFYLPKHPLEGARVLKYVCGGKGKNTFAQHAIIEESARHYKMNISEQEAEVERFGFPMLHAYLSGAMSHKKLDGIIIASRTLLDPEIINLASCSKLKVWCALENMFLIDIAGSEPHDESHDALRAPLPVG